jgi:hypothetical protein
VRFLTSTLAAILAAGAAHAGPLPAGHKAAGEPVCTTVTTVVRRGDVVLSTTSQTRCEEDQAAGQAPAAGAFSSAQARPHAPAVQVFGAVSSPIAKVFGGQDTALKPRDVLGIWSALQLGEADACRVQMMREVAANGFKVSTSGCKGTLARAKVWKFEETQALLYDASGSPVARLVGDRQHLSGVLVDGRQLNLIR